MTFFDLNIPWPVQLPETASGPSTKKSKTNNNAAAAAAVGASTDASQTGLALIPQATQTELKQTVRQLSHLGYSTLAFNLTLPPGTPFASQAVRQCNPCYEHRPPFPALSHQQPGGLLQLSRLTLTLDEATVKSGGGGLTNTNASLFAAYDLLSVLPLDAYAFSHACQSLITPSPISVDIITLDLSSSPRLPFLLKRSFVLSAIKAGVAFEVIYGPTVSAATSTKEARRNVFAGVRELVRVTKGGYGLLLSSGVKNMMELRAPGDVTALMEMLGFKPDAAKASLGETAKRVVKRGYSNRQTFRGAVQGPMVETATVTGADGKAQGRPREPDDQETEQQEEEGDDRGPPERESSSKKRRRT